MIHRDRHGRCGPRLLPHCLALLPGEARPHIGSLPRTASVWSKLPGPMPVLYLGPGLPEEQRDKAPAKVSGHGRGDDLEV